MARSLLRKSLWLIPSGLCAVIYLEIDQIMVERMVGSAEAGLYAVAARLSEAWYVLPPIFVEAVFPILTRLRKNNMRAYERLLIMVMTGLSALAWGIAIIMMFVSPFLVPSIFGPEYAASADILVIHILAAPFVFVRAVMSKWLIIEDILKFSLITQAPAAIANIALNSALIPYYGGQGAAWATLLSYIFASFPMLLLTENTRRMGLRMLSSVMALPSLALLLIKKAKGGL